MVQEFLGLLPYAVGGFALFLLGFGLGFAVRAMISQRRRRRWEAAQMPLGQAR